MLLDITCTNNCNLHCSYCSEGQHRKGVFKADRDTLFEFIKKFDSIGFWGGEPLLNLKLIEDITSEFPDLKYMIYTNGTLIKRYIKRLKALKGKILVQVSYDGSGINDLRGSTSEGIKEALRLLKDAGIESTIKSTVTPERFGDLYDAFLDILSIGSGYFPTPDCFHTYDADKWSEYYTALKTSLLKIARYIKEHNLSPDVFRWFTADKSICGLGKNYFTLDVKADVYPCHSAIYHPDLRIGSIYDVDIDQKLKASKEQYSALSFSDCDGCDAAFCLRCPVGMYGRNGSKDLSAVNQDMCRVFKLSDKIYRALMQAKAQG